MNIVRRPASDDDTAWARAAHHRAYRDVVERQFGAWDEHAQDTYFAHDWAGGAFDIVMVDDERAGYVCIEDRESDIHVRELVVMPEFQNAGVGSAIVRGCLERATERRVPVRCVQRSAVLAQIQAVISVSAGE